MKITTPIVPDTARYDKLGQQIVVGDFVAFPGCNTLMIGKIVKFSPKMINLSRVSTSWRENNTRKYPDDIIKLDDSTVTFYILKHSK